MHAVNAAGSSGQNSCTFCAMGEGFAMALRRLDAKRAPVNERPKLFGTKADAVPAERAMIWTAFISKDTSQRLQPES